MMASTSSSTPAHPHPQPRPRPQTPHEHHQIAPRISASRPISSSSSTTSSDFSNFSSPSSPSSPTKPATINTATRSTPTKSALNARSSSNIDHHYRQIPPTGVTGATANATTTAAPAAAATTTTGFTISDEDITFDGQPLSALYEMTRYRYVHVNCGKEDGQRTRTEERGRKRVR